MSFSRHILTWELRGPARDKCFSQSCGTWKCTLGNRIICFPVRSAAMMGSWGLWLSSGNLTWFGLHVRIVGYHWGATEIFLGFMLSTRPFASPESLHHREVSLPATPLSCSGLLLSEDFSMAGSDAIVREWPPGSVCQGFGWEAALLAFSPSSLSQLNCFVPSTTLRSVASFQPLSLLCVRVRFWSQREGGFTWKWPQRGLSTV